MRGTDESIIDEESIIDSDTLHGSSPQRTVEQYCCTESAHRVTHERRTLSQNHCGLPNRVGRVFSEKMKNASIHRETEYAVFMK